MRIAHVTATFPPYYAGAGNVCYHNAGVLAARGHDVEVVTARYPGDVDDPPGVRVHRHRPVVRVGNAPLLPQVAALAGYDLIHLHMPFVFGAEPTALAVLRTGTPLVVTYHNDLIAPGWRKWFFSFYERAITPRVLGLASRVCTPSLDHASSSRLRRWIDIADHRRLLEVPNGVDTVAFAPGQDVRQVRRTLEIPEGSTVVAFVGALDSAHQFKRVDILLQALAEACRSDLVLMIVGGGDRRAEYERIGRSLGLTSRVRFTGALPHASLPPYYAASDLIVLPSDSVESFGVVLIEAMACGTPVIASDLPGMRSVVNDGVDGVLVPPGDAGALAATIERILELPAARRAEMGAAGRRKVEARYDWDRIGDRLEAVYHEVLAERAAIYAG